MNRPSIRSAAQSVARVSLAVFLFAGIEAFAHEAHAARVILDNFEDGGFNYGSGTHLQVGLDPNDCHWRIREVRVGPGNYAVNILGGLNDQVYFQIADFMEERLRYKLPVADLSRDAGFERLEIHVNFLTQPQVPGNQYFNMNVSAKDIHGNIGWYDFRIDEPGWTTIGLSSLAPPPFFSTRPDLEQIVEIAITPYVAMEIRELVLSGPADLTLVFASGSLGGPIPSILGTPFTMMSQRILSPHSTEPGEPMSVTVQELTNESHDIVDGEIQFEDSTPGDAGGTVVGFTIEESGVTVGNARTLEVHWSYSDPERTDLQLQPLPPPSTPDGHTAYLPIEVTHTNGEGTTWATDHLQLRIEIPSAQPWTIAGMEVEPLSPGHRFRVVMPMTKEPGTQTVEGEALVQFAWSGYHERFEPATSVGSTPRSSWSLVAEPSVMDSSSVLRLSQVLNHRADLLVFDARGRHVRSLVVGPGRDSVEWDGRDGSGFEVGSGVYFAVLRGTAGTARTKIVKLR